jgi:meso-butanediol dehydrogenase / (S,S)-butanediol dehydrogenase / diacetyl reductase
VVNVSSITAVSPFPDMCFYGAYKAAVEHFTRAYAVQYGPMGVRLNCLRSLAILK